MKRIWLGHRTPFVDTVAAPAKRLPVGLIVSATGITLLLALGLTGRLDPVRQVVESDGYRTTERSLLGVIPHQKTEPVPDLRVQPSIFEALEASKIRNMPGITPDAKYGMALHIKRGNGDDYYMVSNPLTIAPAEAVKFYRAQIKQTHYDESHSTFNGRPEDTWVLDGTCPDGKTEFSLKITQSSLGAKDYRYLLEVTRPR